MKKNIFLMVLLSLLFVVSCKPRENTNYLQNIEEIAKQASLQNANSTIQKSDELVILISAKDMDVVKPFNQNYSSSEIIQNTSPGGNTLTRQTTISGPSYIVDSNGNIDFPIIGKLNTTGKTVENFKEELTHLLTRYIKNPIVNIKTANYKIVILGEVSKPGTYTISDGQVTLLSALGLAGDLTMYGVRNNVLVTRNVDGEITNNIVDLTDANLFNSPVYYLKQNDVIYVSSNTTKQKTSRLDPNAGIYIAVASVVLGILGLIFRK